MAGCQCHCTKDSDRDLTGHAAIATHLKDRIMIFVYLTQDTNFESSNFEQDSQSKLEPELEGSAQPQWGHIV
jgi:hypothetical protein